LGLVFNLGLWLRFRRLELAQGGGLIFKESCKRLDAGEVFLYAFRLARNFGSVSNSVDERPGGMRNM
jgi:hypothetical protein